MATPRAVVLTRTVTATPDPPPKGIPNPIHAEDGASAAGYQGALVAGVRTYGWVAEAVMEVAGPAWADGGWADISLQRPLFAGEDVVITVTPQESAASWAVRATVGTGAEERVVLSGTAGLGTAVWFDELAPPPPAPGEPPPAVRETYTVDTAPIGRALRPLRAHLTPDAARRTATEELGLEETVLAPGRAHPWFLAARMAPLTRHNFTYGPTIHVRTQIQHRRPAFAGEIVVGACIVEAYERKGHWYQVLDGTVSDGAGAELARIRHHSIFRPRGTEMPPPITEATAPR